MDISSRIREKRKKMTRLVYPHLLNTKINYDSKEWIVKEITDDNTWHHYSLGLNVTLISEDKTFTLFALYHCMGQGTWRIFDFKTSKTLFSGEMLRTIIMENSIPI